MPSLKAMAREAQTKPQSAALNQPTTRRRTLFKSTEKVEESDIESETESESDSDVEEVPTEATATVRKLNGQKLNTVAAKSVVQGMENGDNNRRHGDAISYSKHNSTGGENISQSSSQSSNEDGGESGSNGGSDESSAESSGSDSDSDDEVYPAKLKQTAGNISSHTGENAQVLPNEDKAILKYDPPDGFTLNSESSRVKGMVTNVFSLSNLAGKQLWYITAPSSVPISAVKQVSLQDVQLGKPALSIQDRHYGFVQEQAEDNNFKKVLIPDGNSGAYITGPKAIDRTLNLQQIVELHKTDNSSTPNPGEKSSDVKRSVRKQPEGLKMRFRPIGFGHGKVGAIGSTSPSTDTSSNADTDMDDSMEDVLPLSRQPLHIGQASMRLGEDKSRTSASQEETSGSGEETDSLQSANNKTHGQVDSRSESGISSEDSNSDVDGSRKVTSASKKLKSPSPRPVKRKIDNFLRDHSSLNSAASQSKSTGSPLNNRSSKKMASTPGKSGLETNNIESVSKRMALSSLPAKLAQLPQPLRSVPTSTRTDGHAYSVTFNPPPRRQSSILPPQKGSKSPDAPRVVKTDGEAAEGSLTEVIGLPSTSNKNNQKNSTVETQSIDSTLSDKARKQEIRRLKMNGVSRTSKIQRRETMNNSANDILEKSVNVQEYPSQSRLHQNSAVEKTLSPNPKPAPKTILEKSSKRITKASSTLAIDDRNGERAISSHDSSITVPALRKESVILPPKFNRSMTR